MGCCDRNTQSSLPLLRWDHWQSCQVPTCASSDF
jgi:hypothetical protein